MQAQTLTPTWKGVVAIERPDPTLPEQIGDSSVLVRSARTQVAGMSAIYTRVPYSMVKHKFRLEDGDSCYCYAELHGEHLQIMERASQREYFLHPEQTAAAH